jgi:hypothetical protein
MNVQIRCRAKALDKGERAGVGFAALGARLLDQNGCDDPMNDLQHPRDQLGMGGQQDAQRDRKRQYPLTHRHRRDDVVHQVRGGRRHAPRPARGAKAAPLARERHELVMRTLGTAQTQKAVGEDAALEKGVERVLDELRQRHAGLRLRKERLKVFLDKPIEYRVFGAPTFVVNRVRCWCVLNRLTHVRSGPSAVGFTGLAGVTAEFGIVMIVYLKQA